MMKKLFAVCLLICAVALNVSAQFTSAPAFPGAEGYGRYTTGGRGGTVYHVTRLDDYIQDKDYSPSHTAESAIEGTLRYAVTRSGARIVVFDVAGTIELKCPLKIKNGNISILGQTAPGDGITLKNYTFGIDADNVIVRYIRCRMGDEGKRYFKDGSALTNTAFEDDAMNAYHKTGEECRNIIIDHCSISWCVDECGSFYGNENFTLQWCVLSESLRNSVHDKGAHGYGGIWGGFNASFHHNLLAHHDSRMIRFDHDYVSTCKGPVDYVNNVVYNWGSNSTYGGESSDGNYKKINMVNNYYKPGPATKSGVKTRLLNPTTKCDNCTSTTKTQTSTGTVTPGHFYLAGNYMYGSTAVTNDNTCDAAIDPDSNVPYVTWKSIYLSNSRFTSSAENNLNMHTAENAFENVVAYAGASYRRDAVDIRIANETRNGTSTYTGSNGSTGGLIDTPGDVGGYPTLAVGTSIVDTDKDGIPDAWEREHGLDVGTDNSKTKILDTEKGFYTDLEVYANYLVQDITKAEREGATESFTEYYPLDDEPTGGDDTDDDTMESYSWSTTTTEVGGLHTLVGEGTVTTETDGTLKFSSSYNATSNYVSIKLSRAIATGDKIKIDYYVGKNSDNTKNAAPKIEYFLNGTSMGSQTMTPVYCLSTTSTTSNTETIDVIDDAVSCKEIRIGRAGGTALYITSISIITQQPTLYTVTFSANGHGTCETSNLKEETEGAGVILPTATPDGGYRFLGWATSSTATVAEYNANTTYKPSADMTLYAVWEKIITPEPVDGYIISSATGTLKNNVWTSSENDDLKFSASSLTYKSGVTPESFKCASGFSGTITVPSDFVVTSVEICGFSQSSSKSTVSISGATSSSPTLQFDQQKAIVTYTIKTPKAGESLILTVANKEFTLESIALIGHPAVVLELSDDIDYESFAEGTYDKVVLKRAFTAGQWSTLVLPFDVTTAELVELFTNSSDAAYITRMTEEGLYYRTTDHVVANTPLLFMPARVSEDGTYTFRNVTVKNATGAIVSEGNGAKMIGVYKSVEGTKLDASKNLFISGNKIYDASYLSTMKPFRAYIELDAVMQQSKVLNLMMDGGTTQLDGLKMWEDGAVMYNMQGQRVKADAKGLKIVGGKKVLR